MRVEIDQRGRTEVTAAHNRARRWVLPLGVMIMLIEGWDLAALGTTAPAMLDDPTWGATASTIGVLGSALAVGMPLGTIVAGRASDIWGRRLPISVSIVWVSMCMFVAGIAPNLTVLGLSLFLFGIGIGGLTTLTITFVADWAPPHRRSLHVGIAQCGVALGGIIVPIVGRAILPELPFQTIFLFGTLAVILVPICWKVVPAGVPSAETDETSSTATSSTRLIRSLVSPRMRRSTTFFAISSFFVVILASGASVMVPTLLVDRGYDMRVALGFTIAFNGGAILGTVAATLLADRGHHRATTIACFLLAATAMLALSTVERSWLILAMCAVAGVGTFGTQNILNGFVASYYPPQFRGTALGVIMGVGRLGAIVGPAYIGLVSTAIAAPGSGFYGFIPPAMFGALALCFVATRQVHRETKGVRDLATPKSRLTH